jgi:hypothetical protein
MNRIKDYTGFVIWFAGLGYIVLWPVSSPDLSGRPFGASIICRDGTLGLLDSLCNSAHWLQLPPALHAIGSLSAIVVTVRLLLYAVRRWRRTAGAGAAEAPATPAPMPAAVSPSWRNPARPLRPVKPRTHFGLRGTPH